MGIGYSSTPNPSPDKKSKPETETMISKKSKAKRKSEKRSITEEKILSVPKSPRVVYSHTDFKCSKIEEEEDNEFLQLKILNEKGPAYRISQISVDPLMNLRYTLIPSEFSCNLFEWLSKHQVTDMYENMVMPTDEGIQLVDSIVKTVNVLIFEGKSHFYIMNPRNIIVLDRVFNFGSRAANTDLDDGLFPLTIKTALVMEDDDKQYRNNNMVKALDSLIFQTIFEDKIHLPEWEHFHDTLLNRSPVFAELHSVCWHFDKRLDFYPRVDDWRKSTQYGNRVTRALAKCVYFLNNNWLQAVQNEGGAFLSVLRHEASPNGDLKYNRHPRSCIRFLRNFIRHFLSETGNQVYTHLLPNEVIAYRDGGRRYLDYQITRVFPNLIADLNEALIEEKCFYT